MPKPLIVNYIQIRKIKELFETGDFILLSKMQHCKWHIATDFSLKEDFYTLVHKDYEEIIKDLIK